MLKYTITLLNLFLFYYGTAQDQIIKNDRTELKVKVIEITKGEVKYKKWGNLNGPIYSLEKADIFMIIYKNGSKDIFDQQIAEPKKGIANNVNTEIKKIEKPENVEIIIEKCINGSENILKVVKAFEQLGYKLINRDEENSIYKLDRVKIELSMTTTALIDLEFENIEDLKTIKAKLKNANLKTSLDPNNEGKYLIRITPSNIDKVTENNALTSAPQSASEETEAAKIKLKKVNFIPIYTKIAKEYKKCVDLKEEIKNSFVQMGFTFYNESLKDERFGDWDLYFNEGLLRVELLEIFNNGLGGNSYFLNVVRITSNASFINGLKQLLPLKFEGLKIGIKVDEEDDYGIYFLNLDPYETVSEESILSNEQNTDDPSKLFLKMISVLKEFDYENVPLSLKSNLSAEGFTYISEEKIYKLVNGNKYVDYIIVKFDKANVKIWERGGAVNLNLTFNEMEKFLNFKTKLGLPIVDKYLTINIKEKTIDIYTF